MKNIYLEKVAAMLRSVESIVGKTKALEPAIANRARKVNMGITGKPDPETAIEKLKGLQNASANRQWKA
jgi:hypothetical protein